MPPAMPNTPEIKDETRMVSPSRASVAMDIQRHWIGKGRELIHFAARRKGEAASHAKQAEMMTGRGVEFTPTGRARRRSCQLYSGRRRQPRKSRSAGLSPARAAPDRAC